MCCSVCDVRPCDLAWGEVQIEGVQEHWRSGHLKALRREANAQAAAGTLSRTLAGDTVTHTEACAMMDKPYCSGIIRPYLLLACHLPFAAPAFCTMPVFEHRAVAPFTPFILPFCVDEVFQNSACHMLSA